MLWLILLLDAVGQQPEDVLLDIRRHFLEVYGRVSFVEVGELNLSVAHVVIDYNCLSS